jgi:hypothetical protein
MAGMRAGESGEDILKVMEGRAESAFREQQVNT